MSCTHWKARRGEQREASPKGMKTLSIQHQTSFLLLRISSSFESTSTSYCIQKTLLRCWPVFLP
jgi:hypothetical protein